MTTLSEPDSHGLHVAVIGGGASGTLTAVQLLRSAARRAVSLRVTLIDQHGRHGLGVAYSTAYEGHLLNAMAGQMSALPDDPHHLVRWANAAGSRYQTATSADVSDMSFLPRAVYGRYLRDLLAETARQARPAGHLVELTAQVLAVRPNQAGPRLRVLLTDGHLDADIAVLATGNSPARLPFDVPPTDRTVADPWYPGALADLLRCPGTRSVVIVGTGLTMADLAIAITETSPDVIVHAVSRHGLLPRTHPGTAPPDRPLWLPAMSRTGGPVRLADLTWQVRSAIAANPASWHDVICSLRPFVPALWHRMPIADKQSFIRHLARYWEIHRHLVPPPTARRLAALRVAGRLVIHRGRIEAVTTGGGQLGILVDSGRGAVGLRADWLVNGTGMTSDITASDNPLLR